MPRSRTFFWLKKKDARVKRTCFKKVLKNATRGIEPTEKKNKKDDTCTNFKKNHNNLQKKKKGIIKG
jgi:hypothetical protein